MDYLHFLMVNGSHSEVRKYIEDQIAAGNTEAMLWKAACYDEEKYGYSAHERNNTAHHWYLKAATLGNKEALFCLICFHKNISICNKTCARYALQDAAEKYKDDPLFTENPQELEQLAISGNYWAQREVCKNILKAYYGKKSEKRIISDGNINLLKQHAQRGHPLVCSCLVDILLSEKKSKHEAWKYHLLHKKMLNNFALRAPLELQGFEKVVKCQGACLALIAIYKFTTLPKDVVVLISKALWETRRHEQWQQQSPNGNLKKIKIFF